MAQHFLVFSPSSVVIFFKKINKSEQHNTSKGVIIKHATSLK
jgi:hypothetical protein